MLLQQSYFFTKNWKRETDSSQFNQKQENTVLSLIKNKKIQILKNTPVEMCLHGSIMLFHQPN